ncbi:MAG: hypothetical protein K2H76_04110 [Muribaculaceae bacterium]|nr:hypothetical protein [Muribaculaceae bacterium]
MFKKLYIYGLFLTLLLAMTACSVDEIDLPSGLSPDGELTVNLMVPEMEAVSTRADESVIASVTMLAVADNKVIQEANLTPTLVAGTKTDETSEYKVTCKLKAELHTKNPKLYFVCNAPASVSFNENESESTLLGKTVANVMNGDNMVMSGVASLNDIVSANGSVAISRNAVKVSVTKGIETNGTWKKGTVSYPFKVFGTASQSRVLAATMKATNLSAATEATVASTFVADAIPYYHPTQNKGRDEKNRPFIIVKAPFTSPITGTEKEYYYRVEFENKDKDTNKITPLNLISNHEYQVIVKEVSGEGDATPDAAAKNPSSLIQVDIYDFAPSVYNLVTDGVRELGVSHQLTHNGNPTEANAPEYFYVKVFSANESDYSLKKENITETASWLEIGEPEEITDQAIIGSMAGHSECAGKVYRVPVHFKATQDPGELSTKITVSWGNLTREIPVLWTRSFNGADLCSASLEIKTGNNQIAATIEDYWLFLNSQCLGVNGAHNNDSIRNEGLHFPINYGGKDKRWSYTYTLRFKNLNDGQPYKWKISKKGKIKDSIQISPSSEGDSNNGDPTITVTRTPMGDDWDYTVGSLVFSIASMDSEDYIDYELDLYHTGFFDNPGKFRVDDAGKLVTPKNHEVGYSTNDPVDETTYYYYEVRKGPQGSYYWLDRNLGAGSAAMYIEVIPDFSAGVGEADAMGKYYRAFKYGSESLPSGVKYHDPEMYKDLCPPGYEIPSMDIWNTLRNSSLFTMALSGTNYLCQFRNTDNQVVYFPKVLWYDQNEVKTGEERTGYYWTNTMTESLEKDQRGNYMRYFKVAGSMAAFDNAEIEGRPISRYWDDNKKEWIYGSPSKGMAMSVRCVNATERTIQAIRTEFKVSGATNVFLYSETPSGVNDDQGNPIMSRNEVTNWPGRQINIYSNMDKETTYWYESSTTMPEQFYVIFNIIDDNGIWTTISKDENGNAKATTTENPKNLKGWKVVNDPHLHTALHGTWKITKSGNSYSISFSNN